MEIALKSISLRLFYPFAGSYCSDPFNVVDLVVTLLGVVVFVPGAQNNVTALRTVRFLRPLMFFTAFHAVRVLVSALISSLHLMLDVAFLITFVVAGMALLGLILFSGSLRQRCVSVYDGSVLEDSVPKMCSLISWGGRHCPAGYVCRGGFENPGRGAMNFDHFGSSVMMVLQATTMEGWSDIMYNTMAATSWWAVIWSVVAVVALAFLAANFFLAVVNAHYTKASVIEKAVEGMKVYIPSMEDDRGRFRRATRVISAIGTQAVDAIHFIQKRVGRQKSGDGGEVPGARAGRAPSPAPSAAPAGALALAPSSAATPVKGGSDSPRGSAPKGDVAGESYSRARQLVRRAVLSPRFSQAILVLILCNTAIMAIEHHGMSQQLRSRVDTANAVFTFLFLAEILLKVYALYPSNFAKDYFNVFDALIVLLSLIEFGVSGGSSFTALRSLRVLRIFRILTVMPIMRALLNIVGSALSKAFTFVVLLVITMAIFAIVGMQLFGGLMFAPGPPGGSRGPPTRRNFDTFWSGFLTVFQILTLEDWNLTYYDLSSARQWAAPIYMVTFIIIGHYLMLNLFASVLLQAFGAQAKHLLRVTPESSAKEAVARAFAQQHVILSILAADADVDGLTPTAMITSGAKGALMRSVKALSNPLVRGVARRNSMTDEDKPEMIGKGRSELASLRAGHRMSILSVVNAHASALSPSPTSSAFARLEDAALNAPRAPSLQGEAPTKGRAPASLPLGLDPRKPPPPPEGPGGADDPLQKSGSRLNLPPLVLDGNSELEVTMGRRIKKWRSTVDKARIIDDMALDSPRPALLEGNERAAAVYRSAAFTSMKALRAFVRLRKGIKLEGAREGAGLEAPPASAPRPVAEEPASAGRPAKPVKPARRALPAAPDAAAISSPAALAPGDPAKPAKPVKPPRLSSAMSQPLQPQLQPTPLGAEQDPPPPPLLSPLSQTPPPALALSASSIPTPRTRLQPLGAGLSALRRSLLTADSMGDLQALPPLQVPALVRPSGDARGPRQADGGQPPPPSPSSLLGSPASPASALGSPRVFSSSGNLVSRAPARPLSEPPQAPPSRLGRLRAAVRRLVELPAFDLLVMLSILVSCVLLCFEHPGLNPMSPLGRFLWWANIGLVVLFSLEALLRIVATGLRAYLRDRWHWLDIAVIALSAASAGSVRGLLIFRAFGALRPLRFIRHVAGLNDIVRTVVRSLPAVLNVLALCVFFWLVFGVVGVQFFSGRFYSCTDPAVALETECRGLFLGPPPARAPAERQWVNAEYNFDNIGQAMLTMCTLTTLEDWETMLALTMDVTQVGEAPRRDSRPLYGVFVLIAVMVSIFLVGMFVGVIAFFYRKQSEEREGAPLLNVKQRMWLQTMLWLTEIRPAYHPQPPAGPRWRVRLFTAVKSAWFDRAITVVIVANIAVLASQHYGQSEAVTYGFFVADAVFTSLYGAEALLRFLAVGPRAYVRSRGHLFDLAVFLLSSLGLLLGSSEVSFVRALRVVRMVRLVRSHSRLRLMFDAINRSLSAIWNVGFLLLLAMFAWAVVAVAVFGTHEEGEFLNSYGTNFHDFPNALLTMFVLSTGVSWPSILAETASQGNRAFALFFFISFVILVRFLVLNVFIGVTAQALISAIRSSEYTFSKEHLEHFRDAWAVFDPEATGYIPVRRLLPFLRSLEAGVVGLGVYGSRITMLRFVYELDLPTFNANLLYYPHVAEAVARNHFNKDATALPVCEVTQRAAKKLAAVYPKLHLAKRSNKINVVAHNLAALYLQNFYRNLKRKAASAKRARSNPGLPG